VPGNWLVIVLLGLTLLTLLSVWAVVYVLYQIIKQQGRLLLRLDELEQHLGVDSQGAKHGVPPEVAGLAVGTAFDSFRLPDLNGNQVALEDFRGQRVLLVNWGPQCGFCDLIAPDLARLQADFRKSNIQLLLVAYGDAESNRKLAQEHGLECPILLQDEAPEKAPSLEALKRLGTPVAYLLDEQGQVAQPIAVGADQVPALAQEAVKSGSQSESKSKRNRLSSERPLSESRIERSGLQAGTPAPPFQLPDVHGRTVSLEEYRGRRVLLTFSDPHCGPCDQLAPHLVRLHQQHRDNNLAVVLVGRGDPEENRRKAEEHGFEFPVVLQERWKLSKEYGIFATPVAYLINEEGVIAHQVAQGVDEILSLAQQAEKELAVKK